MSNTTPPTLNADIIAIYQESLVFVQAHQMVAEYGSQITFEVAPGGRLTVRTRRNMGKVEVDNWQSVKGKFK